MEGSYLARSTSPSQSDDRLCGGTPDPYVREIISLATKRIEKLALSPVLKAYNCDMCLRKYYYYFD